MQVIIKSFGVSGIYVKAAGRLDLDSAVEYGTSIKDAIEDSQENVSELILDFSEITFISSFGLKVILELYKTMKEQGSMKLVNVPEKLLDSFKMVGFDKFLEIE